MIQIMCPRQILIKKKNCLEKQTAQQYSNADERHNAHYCFISGLFL